MTSLADALLAAGAIPGLEQVHGEEVQILTGPDAGKTFTAIVEIDQDAVLEAALNEDRRGRRVIRFREGNTPDLHSQNQVRTADGNSWRAVRLLGNTHLTADYELVKIEPGKDE